MPYSNIPAALTGKMEQCVDSVMKQGNDKRTAIAICYNSIMGKKQGQFIANAELPLNTILSEVKARPTFQPPKAAQEAAQRVLRWREEHPEEIQGMTDVGWGRARQLAEGKPVSLDTVRRMAQFNRHRQNSEIAPEYKGTPWKDAGYVAWLGWGGTEGIDWAKRTHTTHTEQEKKAIARQFIQRCEYEGCEGDATHKLSVGEAKFCYCAEHIQGAKQVFEGHGIKEYQEATLEPIEVELVNGEDRFVWDETQVMETEKKETIDPIDEKQHTSAMIALRPSPELARQLAVADGEEPGALHITLLYIDPAPEDKQQVLETLMQGLAARAIPVKAKINGITLFTETHLPDKNAIVLNIDSPQLIGLRDLIDTMLREIECYPKNDHGFTPHMTLAYVDKGTSLNPADYNLPTEPIYFDDLWLVWKDEWIPFPIRKFDSKAGRFITTEGRVVFVGGPGQGGGSAGAGAVSNVDIANDYVNALQTRLGTNANVEFVKDLTIEDIDGSIVKADAYYNPLDGKIKINEEFLDKPEAPDVIGINCASTASVGYKAVVAHELMHDLDGPDKQYSESEEFLNLFFKEKDRVIEGDTSGVVSKYAFTEPKEFFSEYGSTYIFNPEKLKSMSPDVFSYFDNLIGGE